MNRRFTLVTLGLTATVTFLVGLILAGALAPQPAATASPDASRAPVERTRPAMPLVVNFADVAERINPSVVNIDAKTRRGGTLRFRRPPSPWYEPGLPVPQIPPDRFGDRFDPDRGPRRGSGSGFVIDAAGHILTNYHVIEGAERLTVKLADGRSLPGRVVGADPDTDIALIKVDAGSTLPAAPLGDSDDLRVGEWVCAIGNPLIYEHTVTVGVISYIGRKLFDNSLEHYIQTDAAINFGNSGGPLINARGQVIGINSAVSARAANIGFAVPINQARAILPQLMADGRVSRGYIGVTLLPVDADLEASLGLGTGQGTLVQDVAAGSPADRAGLRPYDVIVGIEGARVASTDALIREIAARRPGSAIHLRLMRNARPLDLTLKLAERPSRPSGEEALPWRRHRDPPPEDPATGDPLGLRVRVLDAPLARKLGVPAGVTGVVVADVEPMSPADDAGIGRGEVLMEINRQPIRSVEDYWRLAGASTPVLVVYSYVPTAGHRLLRVLRPDVR